MFRDQKPTNTQIISWSFRILQGIDTQDIVLHWVDTETEVADTLTKPLCRVKDSALWTPSSTHSSIAGMGVLGR
jgi:hypothetical protein